MWSLLIWSGIFLHHHLSKLACMNNSEKMNAYLLVIVVVGWRWSCWTSVGRQTLEQRFWQVFQEQIETLYQVNKTRCEVYWSSIILYHLSKLACMNTYLLVIVGWRRSSSWTGVVKHCCTRGRTEVLAGLRWRYRLTGFPRLNKTFAITSAFPTPLWLCRHSARAGNTGCTCQHFLHTRLFP